MAASGSTSLKSSTCEAGGKAARTDIFAETAEAGNITDAGLGDEGATALLAEGAALADELIQGALGGDAADLVLARQVGFSGQLCARLKLAGLDLFQDDLLDAEIERGFRLKWGCRHASGRCY